MGPVRIGIVGFGRIGAEHAGWIASASGARAVAAADPTAARRQLASDRGLRATAAIESMLEDPSLEAVLVASPTSMHFQHARQALEADRHVMVEKPLAMSLAEARWLTAEAARRNRVLAVFHNRRWDMDYLTVEQAVRAGVFGRLISVESRLGQFDSCVGPAAREYRPNWRNEAAFGGGGLLDWGSHFLDQMWRLMLPARPLRLFAQLRGNVWTSDADDFARVVIDFDNGACGLVEINTTCARPLPRWHIDGALGSADSPSSPQFDVGTWAKLEFTPAEGGEPRPLPPAPPGLTEAGIWERFASAVRREGEAAATAESALPTMALLDAARESSREGRAVGLTNKIDFKP